MQYDTRNWLQKLGAGLGQSALDMGQLMLLLQGQSKPSKGGIPPNNPAIDTMYPFSGGERPEMSIVGPGGMGTSDYQMPPILRTPPTQPQNTQPQSYTPMSGKGKEVFDLINMGIPMADAFKRVWKDETPKEGKSKEDDRWNAVFKARLGDTKEVPYENVTRDKEGNVMLSEMTTRKVPFSVTEAMRAADSTKMDMNTMWRNPPKFNFKNFQYSPAAKVGLKPEQLQPQIPQPPADWPGTMEEWQEFIKMGGGR